MAYPSKGFALPVTIIVVIGLAMLVLVAVGIFFTSTGGSQISKAEAEQVYYGRCLQYCDKYDAAKNLQSVLRVKDDAQFLQACKVKGIALRGGQDDVPLRCLESCPCDVSITSAQSHDHTQCAAQCISPTLDTQEQQACLDRCG